MRSTLRVILLLTLTSQPALACHHFSRWYYPTPQKCGGVYARARAADPRIWYVEITKWPDGRDDAINLLKKQMNK